MQPDNYRAINLNKNYQIYLSHNWIRLLPRHGDVIGMMVKQMENWCIKNLKLEDWIWGYKHRLEQDEDGECLVFWYGFGFKNKTDLIAFKLVFGDFLE